MLNKIKGTKQPYLSLVNKKWTKIISQSVQFIKLILVFIIYKKKIFIKMLLKCTNNSRIIGQNGLNCVQFRTKFNNDKK